jgi:hypothetical protein
LQHDELPLIIKPLLYKLSIDSLEFYNAFLLDDGINIDFIIFSEIKSLFIYEVYNYILVIFTMNLYFLEFWL